MNVLDAACNTAHDYPGGAKALSLRMGKGANTLTDEVNPRLTHAKLGLLDAIKLQLFADDYRVLYAMAAELGHACFPLPVLDHLDGNCSQSVATVAKEFGELMTEVAQGLADGEVNDNELKRLEREAGQLVSALQQLLRHAATLNAKSKPAGAGAA